MIGWVIAYVDESLRLRGAGLYVLAAVVVPDARADAVRAALAASLRRGQRRVHWRHEDDTSRAALVRLVASLGVTAVAVSATPVARTRQERARRRCLAPLLWELERRHVTRVVLESRQHRDAEDDRMIGYARRAGWVSRGTPYEFARPDEESLLWLPDVVAGACSLALAGKDGAYLAVLADAVALINAP